MGSNLSEADVDISKHSNIVSRQVETPSKSTIFVVWQIYFVVRYDFHVAWRLHYTMTVKHIGAAIDAFLV